MENRLIELETRLAFQDHTLQELNAVVVRQQRDISALSHELETLKAQFKTLAPDLVASRADEPPPPHY
jgi:SlyX protein